MVERFLIVGLGNPGRKYEKTRHNVGFWVVEELAKRHGMADTARTERKAIVTDGTIKGKRVILAKPQTYMNLSGESVRSLLDFYKLDLDHLIVIHDDLDTPLGSLKIRKKGGHGGNNGMRNIIQHVGTQEFARVRFGIGRPPGRMKAVDYVLQAFHGDDAILSQQVTEKSADAVEVWLTDGVEEAMSRFNGDIDKKNEAPKMSAKEELALYERAHELAPTDPKPLEKLIGTLKRIGKLDRAAAMHLKLAEIFDGNGQMAKARTQREKAVSILPELVEVQEQIARSYEAQNNSKKAVNRWLTLARYYEERAETVNVITVLEEALRVNPQHPKALEMQATLLEQSNISGDEN